MVKSQPQFVHMYLAAITLNFNLVISQTLGELYVQPPSSTGEPMIGENRQLVTDEPLKFEK